MPRSVADCMGVDVVQRTRTNRVSPDAAEAVMRAARLEPLVPYPGARERWLCRCLKCGVEVTPRYDNVRRTGGGCWPCAQAARRRVPEAKAVAAMKAAGLIPLEPYPGSHLQWRCRCIECGRVSGPRYKTLVSQGSACKPCAIERRGRTGRIDETLAVEVMRTAGVEPLASYPGAGRPWPCRCMQCDEQVAPSYNSVRMGHAGCWRCMHKRSEEHTSELQSQR